MLPVPDRLFKYVTFDRLNVLRGQCIRFTQPAALNDPWEFKPYLEKLLSDDWLETRLFEPIFDRPAEEVLAECPSLDIEPGALTELFAHLHTQMSEKIDDFNSEAVKGFIELLGNSFGILSLTTRRDNDLMWAHYAADHTGMVLEFDTRHDFFNLPQIEDEDFTGAQPVAYSPDRPTLKNIDHFLDPSYKADVKTWEPFILTKSQSWAYEDEWRMIRPLKSADKTISTDKGGKPLDNPIHLFTLPIACVTGLILGAQMSQDKRQTVVDLIASDPCYAHIALSQAKISNHTFALDIEPV
jgi:hypothetical protein